MASGDVILFEEALDYALGWDDADDIHVAIIDNTTTPSADQAAPALGDFTEVGTGGSYVAGGTSIGTWGAIRSENGGVMIIDSATNPLWAQNGLNDSDARWAIIFNQTQAGDPALAYVDLGVARDMSAAPLTIVWSDGGIARFVISGQA